MTYLATKDSKLIVKDGKLAQDCGCCGGWYCYDGAAAGKCFCVCEDPLKTLPNVLLFNCVAESWNPPPQFADWINPSTGGNVLLTHPQIPGLACSPFWSGSYQSAGQTISVVVSGKNVSADSTSYGEGLNLDWQGPYTATNGLVYLQAYANTFLTPDGGFSAAAGKSALRAICDGVPMPIFQVGATYTATVVRGD